MKRALAIIMAIGISFSAHATVTLFIDAEALKDASGTRISEGNGLVLIVADTLNNGFTSLLDPGFSLTLGSTLNGTSDDLIIAKYAVESGGFGDGCFQVTVPSLTLAGAWNAGDAINLYWFPSLTPTTLTTPAGAFYNLLTGTFGGFWSTPSDGGSFSMSWFTSDATELESGGPNAASLGNASLQIIPEPSTVVLVGMAIAGSCFLRRRKA
jgi:hypothetical protein